MNDDDIRQQVEAALTKHITADQIRQLVLLILAARQSPATE